MEKFSSNEVLRKKAVSINVISLHFCAESLAGIFFYCEAMFLLDIYDRAYNRCI